MNQPALNDKRRPQAAHDPYQVRIAVKRSPDRGTAVGRHLGAERGQVSRAFRHLGSRIDPGGACRIQDRPHAVPPLDTGAVNDPMPHCGTLARARWGLGQPIGEPAMKRPRTVSRSGRPLVGRDTPQESNARTTRAAGGAGWPHSSPQRSAGSSDKTSAACLGESSHSSAPACGHPAGTTFFLITHPLIQRGQSKGA